MLSIEIKSKNVYGDELVYSCKEYKTADEYVKDCIESGDTNIRVLIISDTKTFVPSFFQSVIENDIMYSYYKVVI